MPPPCPTRADLDSFQAGDLEERALAAVSSHVETCSNCQKHLETIIGDSEDTVLHALLAEPEPTPFASEAACRVAVERVASIAGGAMSQAKEFAPTIDLDAPASFALVDPLPVETIREYKLLAKLGEGGMGAVYKALHTRLDKVVALKVLPQGRMRDAGSVARFQREMKAVGRLDHPNIVRAMDAGEEDGTHFLVMEFVDGADLSQLARNVGLLPVADACELIRQAAVGLQEAHEHGMVHRDIKPSNLILAKPARKKSPPTLKILDLGLALLSEGLAPDQELTSTGQMMGTIDYMAPEQGSDTHRVDIRADIYSLGATLYRLLTGMAPFAGEKFDTPVKKILALATQEPVAVQTRRADIPPPLADIIHKMLAKNPAERYATPEELADALKAFCQGTNLAELLAHGTRAGQPSTTGEAPTHPQQSSPSADTAPTFAPSIQVTPQPASAMQSLLAHGRKIPGSLAIAAACGGVALVVLLGVVFYLETLKGTIRVEINDEKIKVVVDKDTATFEGVDKKHSIKVQPGPHGLTITRGDLKFHTESFELTKGETIRLSVKFLAGKVEVVDAAGKLLPLRPPQQIARTSWHGWPADAPRPAIAPFDAKQARKHQEEWADYLGVPVEYENSIRMKFVLIPPGEFMMGSTAAEIEDALGAANGDWKYHIRSEAPQHKVLLTQPIYLGIHEVTQGQYEQVMDTNPSHFASMGAGKDAVAGADTTRHPVEMVSWNDAVEFCAKLSSQQELKPNYVRGGEPVTALKGTSYQLPTEAQWEFACRAGTTTKYWIGDKYEDLSQAGWIGTNAGNRTHLAGNLKDNPFGLFDVHGNVWEWVQGGWESSDYELFKEKPALNPTGSTSVGSARVLRGGDWFNSGSRSRSSTRIAYAPTHCHFNIGFRVALTVDAVKTAIANRKIQPSTTSADWHGWPKDAPAPAIAPFDAKQARKHQEEWAEYLGVPLEYENSIDMKFVLIPPGEFMMGSTAAEIEDVRKMAGNDKRWEECTRSEAPRHKVILTQPVYLGVHEVTQAQYEQVMGRNPSHFAATGPGKDAVVGRDTSSHPVELVCWNDAAEFCATLSEQEKLKPFYFRNGRSVTMLAGTGYRLPTESQWEFACRSGTTTKYWIGETDEQLVQAAWIGSNSGDRTHAVGELRENPFGLYDIHGNVWEWVQDWWAPNSYSDFLEKPAIDPSGPVSAGNQLRVFRGGRFNYHGYTCRSSLRRGLGATAARSSDIGFRVTLTVDAVKTAIAERKTKLATASTGWHGWSKDTPKPAIAPFDAKQARKHQQEWAEYLNVKMEFENSVGMKFTLIPPGEATLGTSQAEIDKNVAEAKAAGQHEYMIGFLKAEGPQRRAAITRPAYLGIHEVTQKVWLEVMGKNPSQHQDSLELPVESISIDEAMTFCNRLSEREKRVPHYQFQSEKIGIVEGDGYRLPTGDEWEYACRAGTATRYFFGDDPALLGEHAWYLDNSSGHSHPVGLKRGNAFGLHDTLGNVCEFTLRTKTYTMGRFPAHRGMAFQNEAAHTRSAGTGAAGREAKTPKIGLRVLLPVPAPQSSPGKALPPVASQKVDTRWHGWPADAPAPAIAPFDAAQARKHQEKWADYLGVPVEYTNTLEMKFVLIPPGEFTLGTSETEIDENVAKAKAAAQPDYVIEFLKGEGPQRLATSNRPCYFGAHEVTQKAWLSVMGTNPSEHRTSEDLPVENISFLEAAAFCNRLSEREGRLPSYRIDGDKVEFIEDGGYRLPKTDEWEYACRAGSTTRYFFGDNSALLSDYDWFEGNSSGQSHPVGRKRANPFGLYDLHGNVSEFVSFNRLATTGEVQPHRGGAYAWEAPYTRSAVIRFRGPRDAAPRVGLRVLLPSPVVKSIASNDKPKSLTKLTDAGWHGWPKEAPAPAIAPFDAKQARKHQEKWAEYLGVPVEWENGIGMKFQLVPPGEFLMGSPPEVVESMLTVASGAKKEASSKNWQYCIRNEAPQHRVILTKPLYLGTYEVTQKQFETVMKRTPSWFAATGAEAQLVKGLDTSNYPVEGVAWQEAAEFCAGLSQKDSTPSVCDYRLPTEAEWEYACRAGTVTLLWSGDKYVDVLQSGWHVRNSGGKTHPVGELAPNPFGLYDVYGNVWEWVRDGWDPAYFGRFKDKPAIDPESTAIPEFSHIIRGGSLIHHPAVCRSAHRQGVSDRVLRNKDSGFRVAISVDGVRQLLKLEAAASSTAAAASKSHKKAEGSAGVPPWHGWPTDAPKPAIAPFDAEQATKHQQEWAGYLKVDIEYKNSIGMKFALIPPGEFTMGSTAAEIEAALAVPGSNHWAKEFVRGESPAHKVILTQPVYLAIHEVTQEQFEKVTRENPSHFSPTGKGKNDFGGTDRTQCPVESVAWIEAAKFCIMLSEREKLKPFYLPTGEAAAPAKGTAYRLPTEAQWEFACRAGTTTKYWTGDKDEDLPQAAWIGPNAKGLPQPVGTLKPNPFGLYDVHGNIWEWVHDWWEPGYYGQFKDQPAIDPSGPASPGTVRMIRGGNWTFTASDCRSAGRLSGEPLPIYRSSGIGFRIALPVEAVQPTLKNRAGKP